MKQDSRANCFCSDSRAYPKFYSASCCCNKQQQAAQGHVGCSAAAADKGGRDLRPALHGVSQLVLVLYSAAHSQAAAGLQTSSADRWPTLVAPASYRREVKLITSADRNDATLIW